MPWSILDTAPVGAGAFAPVDAEYLVLALSGTLTMERLFTPGTGLAAVDGGPGGLYTLNVTSSGGPWDTTGTVVHLDVATNTVAIGTAVMSGSEKLRVLGASNDSGILTTVDGTGATFVFGQQINGAHTGTGQYIGLFFSGSTTQTGGAFAGSITRSTMSIGHTGVGWLLSAYHDNQQITGAAGSGTYMSFRADVGKTGAGTLTDMIGFQSDPSGGGGSVTRYYAFFAEPFALPTSEVGGHFTGATAALEVGAGTPAVPVVNGRWFEDGDMVLGASAMAGTEVLRVVGDARVEGKLTVTGAIDPTDITLSGGGTAHFYDSADGSTAGLSGAATGRFRYNNTVGSGQWEVSTQGGAYTPLVSGATGFLQNGNSFGAAAVLGTNDAFTLSFETSGVQRVRINTIGEATFVGPYSAQIGSAGRAVRTNITDGTVFAATTFQSTGNFGVFNSSTTGNAFVSLDLIGRSSGTAFVRLVGIFPSANNAHFAITTEDSVAGTGERLRVLSSGEFLIGTTTVIVSSDLASFKRDVNSTVSMTFENANGGTSGITIYQARNDTATVGQFGVASSTMSALATGVLADEGFIGTQSGAGLRIFAGSTGSTAEPISFSTAGVGRARVHEDGGLTVGGTITVKGAIYRGVIPTDGTAFAANTFQTQEGMTLVNGSTTANAYVAINLAVRATATTFCRIAAIATAANTSDLAFATEVGNVITERLRILSSGQLQGNAGLTIRGGAGVHTLTLLGGAGAASTLALQGAAADLIGMYGTAAVVQHSSTGQTAGFSAGVGTGVNDDSTFTGGTGASAYTIGDVVRALKLIGLMAA